MAASIARESLPPLNNPYVRSGSIRSSSAATNRSAKYENGSSIGSYSGRQYRSVSIVSASRSNAVTDDGDNSPTLDNWSRGGLSAEVNRDTGRLSSGARWSSSAGDVRWYETHPDTGARIEGVKVPYWPAVRETIVGMVRDFPFLPRTGWDVVVTGDNEFVVLEINAHPGIKTLQVHRSQLRDPRVRRFYEHYGHA